MENSHCCRAKGYLEIKKLDERAMSPIPSNQANLSTPPLIHGINLFFSFKKLIQQFVSDIHDDHELLVSQEQRNILVNFLHFENPQTIICASTHDAIERKLVDWPLSNINREYVIDNVMCKTQTMVNLISPENNVLDVYVEVLYKFQHVFLVSNAMDWILQRSVEEVGSCMVPATESSIELLESKIIMVGDCESCPICLEDIEVSSQASYMSCKHPFHGDCIVMWLRTSHYCPICRLEMPTS